MERGRLPFDPGSRLRPDIQNFDQVELHVMNADGSEVGRLIDDEDMDAHPDWCGVEPLLPVDR